MRFGGPDLWVLISGVPLSAAGIFVVCGGANALNVTKKSVPESWPCDGWRGERSKRYRVD